MSLDARQLGSPKRSKVMRLDPRMSGPTFKSRLLRRISVVQMPLPSIGIGGPLPMQKALVSNHESGEIASLDIVCGTFAFECLLPSFSSATRSSRSLAIDVSRSNSSCNSSSFSRKSSISISRAVAPT
jgi:hypothetical protein